jgi:anti-anti-sigma regulatory factor
MTEILPESLTDLTIENAEDLRQFLVAALERSSEPALDFSAVRDCDTAGLQLICSLRKTATERGQQLRITAISPLVQAAAAEIGLPMEELAGPAGNKDHGV